MKSIEQLLHSDPCRMNALRLVANLNLPQGYIAAGFVRNLVWDYLHGKSQPTALNDIDVIYFEPNEKLPNACQYYEQVLSLQLPTLNWQVRNQAKMHLKNGDKPYQNIVDAMSYWPEKETAIAVRITDEGKAECITSFGLDSLFQLKLSHNSKRSRNVFEQRIASKGWLRQWPLLKVIY